MKRPARKPDGFYYIDGKKYKELFGSREQVVNTTAYKTTGGLTVDDLAMNEKTGRIVSAKKQVTAKKEMRLQKYGYFAKKGKFGYVKKTVKSRQLRKQSRRSKMGGSDADSATSIKTPTENKKYENNDSTVESQ